MKELKPYYKLLKLHRKLYQNKKLWPIAERVYKEIDYERIGIEGWNKLNPLLEQASQVMIRYGIEPQYF